MAPLACRALIHPRNYRVRPDGRVLNGPSYPCPNEAGERGLCELHDHYFRVVLADDRYKDEPPPRVALKRGEVYLRPPLIADVP